MSNSQPVQQAAVEVVIAIADFRAAEDAAAVLGRELAQTDAARGMPMEGEGNRAVQVVRMLEAADKDVAAATRRWEGLTAPPQ